MKGGWSFGFLRLYVRRETIASFWRESFARTRTTVNFVAFSPTRAAGSWVAFYRREKLLLERMTSRKF